MLNLHKPKEKLIPHSIKDTSELVSLKHNSSAPVRIIFLSGGVVMLILSQMLCAQSYGSPLNGLSVLILLLGILLFIVGLTDQNSSTKNLLFTALTWLGNKLEIKPVQILFLLLSLTCAIVAASAADTGKTMQNPLLAVGGWFAGIIFCFLSGWTPGSVSRSFPWRPLAWAAAVMLVAFPIRAVDVSHFPLALNGDEASFGLGAAGFLNGDWNNIFSLNWLSFPALYFLIPASFIHFLGQTTLALRLPSVLAGSLTVAGVYLLGRQFYNHRTGLFGALLLAGLHFHIHFSRLGINNIWDGLFFVLVTATFWRAWQTGRRIYFLLTGLLAGLAGYFYVTARFLPVLIIVWLIIFWFTDRPTFKRNWPELVFMFCMAAVVSAPLAWLYFKHLNNFMAPIIRVSIFKTYSQSDIQNWPALSLRLLNQIVDGFRGYVSMPTRFWYDSGVPVLRPLYAVLFSLGFIPLLIRFRDGRTWLLVTWVAIIAIAGGLSESTPAAQRYVVGAPVAALIAGFCLTEIGRLMQNIWPRGRWWILGASMVIVVIAMFSDFIFYFVNYNTRNATQDINTKTAQRIADYLGQKQGNWQVIFYGEPIMGYKSIASISYLVPQIQGIDAKKPWGDPANPQPSAENVIFIFIRTHEKEMKQAQLDYPGGKLVLQSNPFLGVMDWIYELSPFQPDT